jgi:hypothetical protein
MTPTEPVVAALQPLAPAREDLGTFEDQLEKMLEDMRASYPPPVITNPDARRRLSFELAEAELQLASLPDELAEVGAQLKAMPALVTVLCGRLDRPDADEAAVEAVKRAGAQLDTLAGRHKRLLAEHHDLPDRILELRRLLGAHGAPHPRRPESLFPAPVLAAILTARSRIERSKRKRQAGTGRAVNNVVPLGGPDDRSTT